MEMISVEGLTKIYQQKPVVDDISFHVKKGETLVLLGTSGSGKTTTLKMLNRLVAPNKGKIFIGGKDVANQAPEKLRRTIGYVIQHIGLFPHMTVAQNIATVPRLLGWEENKISDRIKYLLDLLGLPENIAFQYPDVLSGGQQQRVGLARALAADPPIVLLDEPFGALDPLTRRHIHADFISLGAILSKTMVLVTHDTFEAIELGDRICLMNEGQIQQIGTPKELIFEPANEFVWGYFKTQRFQLEMKVLHLRDLMSHIKTMKGTRGDKIVFNFSTSFLETMERVEANKSDDFQIAILDEENQKMYYTRKDKLWLAFNQVKEEMIKI